MLPHQGEKGRALEDYVHRFLRDALPQEYGITTGFIAFPPEGPGQKPTLSGQLDIIIYDALRGSPLMRLPTCDVLPLEAVLAYVEVKASVDGSVLRACAKQAHEIRRHTTRWFWTNAGSNHAHCVGLLNCVGTRSYVFAFEGTTRPETVQRVLVEAAEANELAAFSGVFINDCGLFQSAPIAEPVTTNVLATFRRSILHGLARYPRYAPGHVRGKNALSESRIAFRDALASGAFFEPPTFIDSSGCVHEIVNVLELTTPYLDHYAIEEAQITPDE